MAKFVIRKPSQANKRAIADDSDLTHLIQKINYNQTKTTCSFI